jgi:RNA polymerase sigma factor (sigma-70 family)
MFRAAVSLEGPRVEDYIPLVKYLVKRFAPDVQNRPDLVQDCLIVGLKAAKQYDWRRGPFKKFLAWSVRKRLLSRPKCYDKAGEFPLDNTIPCPKTSTDFGMDFLTDIDILDRREKQVLKLYYVYEYSFREIGTRLKVSGSRAQQIFTQSLTKLKGVL